MQWEDIGIVLKYRSYSEKQLIASIFTQHYGRVDGMVMRTKSSLPQPGDFVKLQRKARLEQHLGALKLETRRSNSSLQFCESTRVYALKSMLEMLATLLPEHHPYEKLWQHTNGTILSFYNPNEALKAYCLFEVVLVEELGFGLSLNECAVTGSIHNLSHVSPKTGRAVCYEAAEPYITKLLPLPKFLIDPNTPIITATDYTQSLQLTGYFLLRYVSHNRPLPIERSELLLKLRTADQKDNGIYNFFSQV